MSERGSFTPEVPCTCSPHCELQHGDQAPTADELEIDRLQVGARRLLTELSLLRAELAAEREISGRVSLLEQENAELRRRLKIWTDPVVPP